MIVALVVIGLPLLVYLSQDSLIFHPQPMAESQRLVVSKKPLVESISMEAPDGTRLHAWHVKGEPLVLYFGGNAEEVSWMLDEAARLTPGAGWLLVDYRGYGSSGGSPSESSLREDGLRWFDHVAKGNKRVYVFGRSLGSGVAVQVAAARPVAGVILVAPFDSMVAMGKHYYPVLPVSLLLRHRFESAAAAPGITAPLLCIVAERDEIIPAERSR
ncbi:MAG: alpha/beta fold hydrolase, partial [Burkholderiales bacterium]|nr:alpha/beta fold hydrolase [Burkholderiales bacterium]